MILSQSPFPSFPSSSLLSFVESPPSSSSSCRLSKPTSTTSLHNRHHPLPTRTYVYRKSRSFTTGGNRDPSKERTRRQTQRRKRGTAATTATALTENLNTRPSPRGCLDFPSRTVSRSLVFSLPCLSPSLSPNFVFSLFSLFSSFRHYDAQSLHPLRSRVSEASHPALNVTATTVTNCTTPLPSPGQRTQTDECHRRPQDDQSEHEETCRAALGRATRHTRRLPNVLIGETAASLRDREVAR